MNAYLIEINAALLRNPSLAIALHFIICACLGSYFNLFAWRWPQIQERSWMTDIQAWFEEKGWAAPQHSLDLSKPLTLSRPGSFCPSCGSAIPLYYNVPVLGWVILRGKAACCGKPISIKYPLFELVCGSLGVFAWLHFHHVIPAWIFLLLAMPLCMASQTDFESQMLPDSITGFVLFSGLGLSILGFSPLSPLASFAGMAIGFATLSAIRILGSLAFKREAMGQGDPKLMAALGAWTGALMIPQLLLIAALSALAFALASKMVDRQQGRVIPFGPFLAIGALVCFVFGNLIS